MLAVKNGIMKGRFPIIACRNLREDFCEICKNMLILSDKRIMNKIYA